MEYHSQMSFKVIQFVQEGRQQTKRACISCRETHRACDRKRPCSACIFRGIEEQCVDMPRKKEQKNLKKMQKYFMEYIHELAQDTEFTNELDSILNETLEMNVLDIPIEEFLLK